jgi:hypothetical protein
MHTSCAAGYTMPGELLRLVTDGMTRAGFDVRPPEHDESDRMTIACAGERCTLAVNDQGLAVWDYCPRPSGDANPDLAADIATTLLTGRPGPHPRLRRRRELDGITFKGLVGLELKARGLDVELAVYTDDDYFDAFAEIVATAPGTGDEARVCVADDGCVTWTRSYWAEAATIMLEPEFRGWIADPASVAAAIVTTVTRAMPLVRHQPPPAGPAPT